MYHAKIQSWQIEWQWIVFLHSSPLMDYYSHGICLVQRVSKWELLKGVVDGSDVSIARDFHNIQIGCHVLETVQFHQF